MRRPSALLPCVFVLLAAACGSGSTARSGVEVRDSAGVTIVENGGAARDATAAWRVGAEPLLRIGAVQAAEPAYEFSRIGGMTRLRNGHIVVLEAQAAEVRFFDGSGRHLVTRGGRGRGPGEFNSTGAVFTLPGDTVVVEDRPLIRHVLYSPDGELIREELLDQQRLLELGPWHECLMATLPDRSLLRCRPEPGEPPRRADPGPGLLRTWSRFVRLPWALDGEAVLGRYGGLEQFGISVGGRTQYAIHPFHSRTAVAYGGTPLRIAIAVNPEYSIEVWRPDGTLDRIVRRTGAARAPTAVDRESARAALASYARGDEALANRFIAEVPEPPVAPAVIALVVDAAGYLWVGRGVQPPHAGSTWDVFDTDGVFLGEVQLPRRFAPHEIGEDYILGRDLDDDFVPFVHVYPLDRGRG